MAQASPSDPFIEWQVWSTRRQSWSRRLLVQQCTGLFFASSRDGLGLHILEYLISQLEIILENLELLFEP
jgi:hypothetical protein